MEDMQIIRLEGTEITSWDYEQIRTALQRGLDQYAGVIYTDDTIKTAKDDRSTLNKVKKVIDDARKAYKTKCLAPYEAMEPQIKELIDMVERQRAMIDDTVKEYETRQKEAREQEIRKYYDRKASVLGDLADVLYPKLFDKKWANASTTRAKYEEGVQTAINNASMDLEAIRELHSVFEKTLMQTYAATLSLQAAKDKQAELQANMEQAGLTAKAETVVVAPPAKEQLPMAADGVTMKVYAGQSQMTVLCDFMKAIGVQYEFV